MSLPRLGRLAAEANFLFVRQVNRRFKISTADGKVRLQLKLKGFRLSSGSWNTEIQKSFDPRRQLSFMRRVHESADNRASDFNASSPALQGSSPKTPPPKPSLRQRGAGSRRWKTEDNGASQTEQSEINRANGNQSAPGPTKFIRGD